jgi:3-oxoacyl-(acyl-carrier-protein) synthase
MKRILHRCIISDNRITVNGQAVFQQVREMEFEDFAKAAFKHLQIAYPRFYKMDGLCKLGFLAAEYLFFTDTGCHPGESTAIVLGNSSGSLDSDLKHAGHIENNRDCNPSPSAFVYTLPNIVAGEIAVRHGIKGENTFFICGRDDGSVERYAEDLLYNHTAGSCLSGWVDYLDGKYFARLFWIEFC